MIETMHWENGKLILLDQTKLPHKKCLISCTKYEQVRDSIARLEVRGAPAIGAAAAYAMVLGAKSILDAPDFLGALAKIKNNIISARPTAVNLSWGAEKIFIYAKQLSDELLPPYKILQRLEVLAAQIYNEDILINHKIGQYGAAILPENTVLLTHCNAGSLATCGYGTALGVVREAYSLGKLKMVYADETRPLLQGARLTAFELCEDNIPVTVITDSMAAWTMKTKNVNAIVVGADRIANNGDTANKIGTFGIALAAKEMNIPFYIAAPTSTFDFTISCGAEIPIEERLEKEIRFFRNEVIVPEKALVYNPAFDVTPSSLITGIITEYGIIKKPYTENIRQLQNRLEEES